MSVELLSTGRDPEEPCLHQQLQSLSNTFSALAANHGLSVPKDFSIKAMKCLKESGRKNVIYSLAKSLATPRSDGSGSKFPTTRMPMGLLEYMVSFYQADNIQKVSLIINTHALNFKGNYSGNYSVSKRLSPMVSYYVFTDGHKMVQVACWPNVEWAASLSRCDSRHHLPY